MTEVPDKHCAECERRLASAYEQRLRLERAIVGREHEIVSLVRERDECHDLLREAYAHGFRKTPRWLDRVRRIVPFDPEAET